MAVTAGAAFSDNIGRNAIDGVLVFLRPVPRYAALTLLHCRQGAASIQALLAVTIHIAQGITTPADPVP
ncbi:MAG: hypothetical protein AB7J97_12655 [Steroidobacteraceae bacterium]